MNTVLIIYNARIYTQDEKLPVVPSIAIDVQNGRILAIGQNDFILSEFDEISEKYDAQGYIIIPGLIDAHIHLQQYALGLEKIDCETATRDECLRRVQEKAKNSTPGIMDIRTRMESKQLGRRFRKYDSSG
jgi:predicted amidohydrolase YtcJ